METRTCKGCGRPFSADDDEIVRRWIGEEATHYCDESCWAHHTMPAECRVCFGIVGQDCTC
jgi:hypothetical protein